LATAQVACRIDLGRLAEEGVSAGRKLGLGAGIVAIVADRHSIDQIAAQSHQCSIFSLEIQRDWRNVETALNSRFLIIPITLRLYGWRLN